MLIRLFIAGFYLLIGVVSAQEDNAESYTMQTNLPRVNLKVANKQINVQVAKT